jgi:hypothetical protein
MVTTHGRTSLPPLGFLLSLLLSLILVDLGEEDPRLPRIPDEMATVRPVLSATTRP